MTISASNNHGFTLIEMAVVLLVVTLLLGGLLVPLSTQIEQRKISETQKLLEDAKEALVGYAAGHFSITDNRPYLPCPDLMISILGKIPNDGQEDRCSASDASCVDGQCVYPEGNLPWVTLGISPTDSWGNKLHYRVSNSFSSASVADGITLTSTGDIRICPTTGCAAAQATGNNIPAVILSYGSNGWGALSENGTQRASPTSTDERENVFPYLAGYTNTIFVSRTQTQTGTGAGEFDDIVTWLSPNILFNRMIVAGRLP